MNNDAPSGDGSRRLEIGIDGKAYEVWQPQGPAPERDAGYAGNHGLTIHQPPQAQPHPVLGAPLANPEWLPAPIYTRGTAEAAVLATPRRTTEYNEYAWYSLGLGGTALFLSILNLVWSLGLIVFAAVIVMAVGGAYYGRRSHSAGLRGFCTNGRMGLVGFIISAVVLVAAALNILLVFWLLALIVG